MNTVKARWVVTIGIMVVLAGNLCEANSYGLASPPRRATQANPAPPAENVPPISDNEACQRMKTLLPLADKTLDDSGQRFVKITGTRLSSAGYILSLGKRPEAPTAYTEIRNLTYSTGHIMGISNNAVVFDIPDHRSALIFPKSDENSPFPLYVALRHFVDAARVGRHLDCTGNNVVVIDDLDTFAQETAAWRAMATKPAISDEVTKRQLLAEDAIQERDLGAAVAYYKAGVAIDPTWAKGWYNAALISAESKNFSDAAFDMKHYLILLPDAPDAAAVKERLLLWEAKAEGVGK